MSSPVLATKLYIPPLRPKIVSRLALIQKINDGISAGRKLTLISAPAGFGKTTLVSEWVAVCGRPVAWFSLDEGDNDPARFLIYLVTALQTIWPNVGAGVLRILQSPQLPPTESILTTILNEITTIPDNFILVLDDYHLADAKAVDNALTFLLDHLPSQMHLVITTREDPNLPLARFRVRGQLTELRAADLRFTPAEAAEFLKQVMELNISTEDVIILEARTEGWIAGLQLAALSMQGLQDIPGFIQAFAGDHRYIVDYLVEEVLKRQPEAVRSFLLQTSILDRLNGPLCEAVTGLPGGKARLDTLQRGNFFLIPLDDKRYWYRYHHLFADVLRMHLQAEQPDQVPALHRRASEWYEQNDLEIEAFQQATAANDIERAERLMEGKGIPLQYRGAMTPILHWLESLPTEVLDAKPSLWVTYASASAMVGKSINSIEAMLQAAETALQDAEPDGKTRDLVGHVAAIRAMLAFHHNQVETMLAQSHRALEYLHPKNLPTRATTTWTLGYAYQLQGDRAAAKLAYNEAISISQESGNIMVTIAAATCLGQVYESENQLFLAAESYRRVLQLAGDPPQSGACEAYLGLARVFYQWNNLDTAQQHGQQSLQLARQMENVATPAACGVMLARLKLAQGEVDSAATYLAQAEQFVRLHNFVHLVPEVAAAQVITMLHRGNLTSAAHLAGTHELPISQARVYLAQGDARAALAVLELLRQQVEAKGWVDERLKIMSLQAVAFHAFGEHEQAVQVLGEALTLAEPQGYIRLFLDEGPPMAQLLREANAHGIMPDYTGKLLAGFETQGQESTSVSPIPDWQSQSPPASQSLIEPLSQRELDVVRLFRTDLSGREIAQELVIALSTVRTHTKSIFSKFNVNNRRAAVKRAAELDLI
jgi:LuxR family transcriptional regulator, maltose regulon positive regulatory protein